MSFVDNNPVRYNDPSGHCARASYKNKIISDYECETGGKNIFYSLADGNYDGKVSQDEAEVYFVNSLQTPGNGLMATTKFGAHCTTNVCSGQHAAVDFSGSEGANTPITAAAPGVVVDVDSNPAGDFGAKVVIEHDVFGYKFYSIYAHLSGTSAIEGNTINAGDPVGLMGNTPCGNCAIHLHFEVRKATNVNLDSSGNYESLPSNGPSYWAKDYEDMRRKFVNLGPRFGYSTQYPSNWPK